MCSSRQNGYLKSVDYKLFGSECFICQGIRYLFNGRYTSARALRENPKAQLPSHVVPWVNASLPQTLFSAAKRR